MPIDPLVNKTAMTAPKPKPMAGGPRPNASAGQMGQLKSMAAAGNKKIGLRPNGLQMGSVRANAARAAAGDPGRLAKQQGLKQGTFNNVDEMQRAMAMRDQEAQLNVGPSQPPYAPPPQEMGAVGPEMAGMGINPDEIQQQNMLNIGPQQLPFNPNSGIAGPSMAPGMPNPGMNNPMGSMPGQFGPVNPQVQQGLMAGRGNMAGNIDRMRQNMAARRGRGGY